MATTETKPEMTTEEAQGHIKSIVGKVVLYLPMCAMTVHTEGGMDPEFLKTLVEDLKATVEITETVIENIHVAAQVGKIGLDFMNGRDN